MVRYYRCLVAAARIELPGAKPDAYTRTLRPLRQALPTIKAIDAGLYSQAQAAIAGYRATLSKDVLAKDDAIVRIEAAADKLEAAIAEAEAPRINKTRDYFWGWAASPAMHKGNYEQAADLMMKASSNLGTPNRPKGRDEDISSRVVRSAAQKRAYDSARYAIDKIEDKLVRAQAMLELAQEFGRWQVAERETAKTMAINALDLMEMTTPDPLSICIANNARFLLIYGAHPRVTLEDLAAGTVRLANRIPTRGADAKVGTPERTKFVTET